MSKPEVKNYYSITQEVGGVKVTYKSEDKRVHVELTHRLKMGAAIKTDYFDLPADDVDQFCELLKSVVPGVSHED